MAESNKWDSASNWREIPWIDFKNSQVGYEYSTDGKLMSSKMVDFLNKIFGDKPVEFYDDGIEPEDLKTKELSTAQIYHEGYDKRLPGEYHVIHRSVYPWGNLYVISLNGCALASALSLYVRLKKVPIDSKVIQDAIIDGDADYPDDLESVSVKIGEFVYNPDLKQHHINNEYVTVYYYKDNTFLSIGQYGGGVNVSIKGKYSLEDIKKWFKWGYDHHNELG